jgi:ubiquinone/menaquinone biosynthesis C-methylase UbiE
MKLSKIEFIVVNNPIRNFIQDKIEFRRIRKMVNMPENLNVLEIGCGTGNGSKLIKKYFNPKKITSIDLDEKMIKIANKKNKDRIIKFQQADAEKLPFKNHEFDAVFEFTVLHHVTDWEKALKEIFRVLKPGGYFVIEDLSIETFKTFFGYFYRKFSVHPYETMYRHDQLIEGLIKTGFTVLKAKRYNPLGVFKYINILAVRAHNDKPAF